MTTFEKFRILCPVPSNNFYEVLNTVGWGYYGTSTFLQCSSNLELKTEKYEICTQSSLGTRE